jgi:acetyltransferase-like isoleucine patch superfamily enzyme
MFQVLICVLPWRLRRSLLIRYFKFDIDPSARIGLSWVYPTHLKMGPNAQIGSLSVVLNLDKCVVSDSASIGRQNWITGYPKSGRKFFIKYTKRESELFLGRHSCITKNHHIDCTDSIHIGEFSTIAGYQSQLLTHSIDIENGEQACSPIHIGKYCFVGTRVVILPGAKVPDFSVVGAGAVLNKKFEETHSIYGGVPARHIKSINPSSKYFQRLSGEVL